MDRDATTVPIGQTVLIGDTPHIKAKFSRVSDQKGVIEYSDPANGATVLRVEVGVYDGSSELEYMDQNFWIVTVNGRPILPGETPNGKMNLNAQARTINFTT